MLKLEFSAALGGRLLPDYFNDIRLDDEVKFQPGTMLEIHRRGKMLGVAEIMSCRKFKFVNINDDLSYIQIGKPAHYLARLLQKFYEKHEVITADTVFVKLVLKWSFRKMEEHMDLFKEHWNAKLEEQNLNANQLEIFND